MENLSKEGFFKAFIEEYYEEKIYSYYPSKDRLDYILCDTDIEKDEVTNEKIKLAKSRIKSLGFEELSLAYLQTLKLDYEKAFGEKPSHKFWIERCEQKISEHVTSLTPVTNLYHSIPRRKRLNFDNLFFDIYNQEDWPKERDLYKVLQIEPKILSEIEHTIDNYKSEDYWEFDFNALLKYKSYSRPLELLFNISELLVQLNLLVTYKSFTNSSISLDNYTKNKLSIPHIALLYVYQNKQITRANAKSIVQEYGYASGDKLYNQYCKYSSPANRKGMPTSQLKLKNKIALFEGVISLLPPQFQHRPKDEINILNSLLGSVL